MPAPSALQLIRSARKQLAMLLDAPGPALPAGILEISRMIECACLQDRNVVLATILLDPCPDYAIRHAVDVAIVTETVLADMDLHGSERSSVVAAALTMNIGMQTLQATLAKQQTALTPEQRQAIQQHPGVGRQLLRELGVADSTWLDCVEQHHEAPDGTGYPRQLAGDAIRFDARLIGLADRYCAILSNRVYRRGQTADNALFTSLGSENVTDRKLATLFARSIGIYPCGAVVQLINGESGVVLRQGSKENTPEVLALFDQRDNLLACPVIRDSSQIENCIARVLDSRVISGAMPMAEIWGESAALPA